MRIIDLHCYPGTQRWIDAQGPYPEALATYWKRDWVAKQEDEVIAEFAGASVQACLVALDLEKGRVTAGDLSIAVTMPAAARESFLDGSWDATGLLLDRYEEVEAVAARLHVNGEAGVHALHPQERGQGNGDEVVLVLAKHAA